MPLRDRDRSRPRRLVRLGIIRLGHKEEKRQSSGRVVSYPVQDDHFVLTDAPDIAEVYGDEPRELDVILPFPDIARNFDGAYTVWAGGVLVCRGDGDLVDYASPMRVEQKAGNNGKTRTAVYNESGDTLVMNGVAQVAFQWNGAEFQPGDTVPCPGAVGGMYPHCAACKLSAILKVMMARPELFRMGYYQVATGSGRNYDTILGALELISGNGARPVNGIPFKLRLVKEQITYMDDGKRKATEKYFLQLEPDPTFTRALYAQQARQLIGAPAPALIEAGEDVEDVVDMSEPAPPPLAEEGGPATDYDADEIEYEDEDDEPEPQPEPEQSHSDGLDALDRDGIRQAWSELFRRAQPLGVKMVSVRHDIGLDEWRGLCRKVAHEIQIAEGGRLL